MNRTVNEAAPRTTWKFVTISPSSEITKPVPVLLGCVPLPAETSMETTASTFAR